MRRSILTEKVSRRGYYLSREYATDPLEIIFVREVMRIHIVALPDTLTTGDLAKILHGDGDHATHHGQRLYPVLNAERALRGCCSRRVGMPPTAKSHIMDSAAPQEWGPVIPLRSRAIHCARTHHGS